jgi:hypothetical protein
MSPPVALRPRRVAFVVGAILALTFGTAGLARADTACAPTDVSCSVAVAPTVPPDPTGDTVDQVQNGADGATKTAGDTVSTAKGAADDVVNGLLGSGDPDPGGGGDGGGGGSGGGSGTGGGHGSGDHRHGDQSTGPLQPITAPGSAPVTTGTSPGTGLPPVDRALATGSVGHPTLAQTVTGIALGVIAPLLILLLCAFGFVMFQQRLDGRDPHLADAPAVPDVAVFG